MNYKFFLVLFYLFICVRISVQPQCLTYSGYGGPANDLITALAVDGVGNTFLSGSFSDSTIIGGQLITSEGQSVFVACLNTSHQLLWYKIFSHNLNSKGTKIAVVGNSVFLTGHFFESVCFGNDSIVTYGGWDIFLVKLDASTGNHLWLKRYGNAGGDFSNNLEIAQDSSIYITGEFRGYCAFDSHVLICTGTCASFIAKVNQNGTVMWVKQGSSPHGMQSNGLALISSDRILISGIFSHSTDFGSGIILTSPAYSAFIACYDTAGNIVWANTFPYDEINYITSTGNGFVYGIDSQTEHLFKINVNGSVIWNKAVMARKDNRYGIGYGISHDEHVFISNTFTDVVSFGSDTLYGDINNPAVYVAVLDSSGNCIQLEQHLSERVVLLPMEMTFTSANKLILAGEYYCIDSTSADIFQLPSQCDSYTYNCFIAEECALNFNNEIPSASVSVFPNPSEGIFNIRFASETNSEAEIFVYDAAGKLQLQINQNLNLPLNLSSLKAGYFSLCIRNGSGFYHCRVLIY
jgi:hypothetical protein